MRRMVMAAGLALAAIAAGGPAEAQWSYPGGYGGYGMSRWGADPGAGYMAGLGAYSRAQGSYAVDKAKADAINVETMVKWNKALRARQAQLREDKAKEDARRDAELKGRVERLDARDGTTLNAILMEILDADPAAARASKSTAPLSPAAIREIPFEWDSEAISICLDQMTGEGSLPPLLKDEAYAADRDALRAAVVPALEEDRKGEPSAAALAKVRDAASKLRATFQKKAADYDPGYLDAKNFLTTLESLTRLLQDPSMKAFLKQLDDGRPRTVGDLIAFMNAFNLRFGPATSDRQAHLYAELIPALTAARDAAAAGKPTAAADRDADGAGLRSAATDAFKGMGWDELDAHGRAREE